MTREMVIFLVGFGMGALVTLWVLYILAMTIGKRRHDREMKIARMP